MDNQDNLFNKIKSAAENAETKEFPTMEKVWSRIDAKLDTKIEKKNNTKWKILLAAASVVVLVSIGYQMLQSDKSVATPQNTVVKSNPEKSEPQLITPKLAQDSTAVTFANPKIKKDANTILEKALTDSISVVNAEKDEIAAPSNNVLKESYYNSASANSSSNWLVNRKFESRGVTQSKADDIGYSVKVKDIKTADKSADPIVVVDGEVYKKELSNLDEEEVDSILELPEPLYIINGVSYSEKELFGPNASSPYAPLNKQKIETISILQPEKAVTIYGEKGKKGVVIITTKDGKPFVKKE